MLLQLNMWFYVLFFSYQLLKELPISGNSRWDTCHLWRLRFKGMLSFTWSSPSSPFQENTTQTICVCYYFNIIGAIYILHFFKHILSSVLFLLFATQCADGAPVKLVQVGNVNTPLMCLAPSSHYQGRTTLWAGCGTRVLSLTVDYDISKSIDTRPAFDQ